LGTLKEDVQHTESPARLAPARGRGSREHLGVEAVDLYQIHWPVPDEKIEEG
jgi:diketogulonate reductase-like aldo/keto reductase